MLVLDSEKCQVLDKDCCMSAQLCALKTSATQQDSAKWQLLLPVEYDLFILRDPTRQGLRLESQNLFCHFLELVSSSTNHSLSFNLNTESFFVGIGQGGKPHPLIREDLVVAFDSLFIWQNSHNWTLRTCWLGYSQPYDAA